MASHLPPPVPSATNDKHRRRLLRCLVHCFRAPQGWRGPGEISPEAPQQPHVPSGSRHDGDGHFRRGDNLLVHAVLDMRCCTHAGEEGALTVLTVLIVLIVLMVKRPATTLLRRPGRCHRARALNHRGNLYHVGKLLMPHGDGGRREVVSYILRSGSSNAGRAAEAPRGCHRGGQGRREAPFR